MTLEQLGRLQAMCDCLPGSVASWDLNREDQNAIRAAICGMPNPRLVEALEAVLLFYSPGQWSDVNRFKWELVTSGADATTKGLCDFIRKRLAEPFGEHVQPVVKAAKE